MYFDNIIHCMICLPMHYLFKFSIFLQDPSFSECGCVMENLFANLTSMNTSGDMDTGSFSNASAMPGFCNRMERCSLVGAFALVVGMAILLNYARVVPILFITIR